MELMFFSVEFNQLLKDAKCADYFCVSDSASD